VAIGTVKWFNEEMGYAPKPDACSMDLDRITVDQHWPGRRDHRRQRWGSSRGPNKTEKRLRALPVNTRKDGAVSWREKRQLVSSGV
jgi:hypothetical protein